MIIKKYPQSHLVITNDQGKRLIIDPGYLTYDPSTDSGQVFTVEDFQGADVYLITHQHTDHLDPQTIKEVVGQSPVYGNFDVVLKLKEVGVIHAKEVKNREKFSVAGFEIEAVDLPHFRTPGDPPPNTGFVIDGVFFHGGDGDKIDEDLSVDNAALAYGHPALSTLGVLGLAKTVGAKILIPIHFDKYPRDVDELKFASEAYQFGIKIVPLKLSEETEI